jgi:VCBS repeat-containing protein
VLEKSLAIVAANFFGRESVDVSDNSTNVILIESKSNYGSIIINKGDDGSYTISVADPTRTLSEMEFTVSIKDVREVISADNGVTASVSDETVTVKVNCADSLGQSFTLTVK